MNGLRKWFASGRRLGPTVRRLATVLVVLALLVPAGVAVPQSEAAIPVEGPVGASGAYGGDASRCEAGDPDFPECWTGANCTAKDAGTLQLRLADWVTGQPLEPCSPGETANAVVMATIDSNTNRYQALAYFSLYINGVFEGDYVVCFADMIAQTPPHSPPSDYRVFPLDVPLQWECGDKVEFRAFYLGWNQSSATCSATACCPGTKSKCERFGDVTVLTPLVASFTYQTGCNRAVSFDDTVTGGVEPYTRLWNFGDGVGTSSAADPTYTYGAAGTYTVTLTVTDNEGTEATWEEEITVPAGVGVSIAADPGLVLTCDHPTIELEATGSGGTAPYSYAWDLDGLPGYETPGAVQYVTQAGIYTVQVTDANLCTATDSVEVTDERDLAVEIDATPGLVLTCDDPSIQLEAKASGGDGSYTYAWDLDGDGQYDDATSAVVTGINAEGSYAVRVSDGGGCVVYDSVQVDDQRDLTAEIEATPGLVLTCDVASIQLEAKASGGDGSYAYAWDLDDDGDYDDAYTAVVTGIDA
ncbi:MAG: PKD domain-containing protein, partial [Anaerolineae bacterium]|nr:PKD domain-containing protein [Anaerolineae bacterium]